MIYLLTGTNQYRIEQEIARIAKRREVTPERIEVANLDRNALADIMRGMTLFSLARMVVIDGLSSDKELWQLASEWATEMNPDTTLVLVEAAPDRRTKAYKTLLAASEHIDASSWGERDQGSARTWLQKIAASANLKLSVSQCNEMIARATIGEGKGRIIDQFQLAHAIRALSLLPEVTDEAIAAVLPPAVGDVLFELIGFAAERDKVRVYAGLADLRLNEDPHKVFSILAAEWSRLVAVALAPGPAATTATELSMHPFVVQKLERRAKSFTHDELRSFTQLAADIDAGMKRSEIAPWDGVDRFLLGLTIRP